MTAKLMITSLLKTVRPLSSPVTVRGRVIPGDQTGASIGFPTANLDTLPKRAELEPGVYFGTTKLLEPAGERQYYCLPYFGPRLIFGEHHHNFEVYLFDFSGSAYGFLLSVSLTHYLRPPVNFQSLTELKTALKQDKAVGQSLIAQLSPPTYAQATV